MPNQTNAMACPVDGTTLVMSERSGIEIDYCPSCRGVWLDRGELDKIIERNATQNPPSQPPTQQDYSPGEQHRGYGDPYRHHRPHKRKKSFLEELFD